MEDIWLKEKQLLKKPVLEKQLVKQLEKLALERPQLKENQQLKEKQLVKQFAVEEQQLITVSNQLLFLDISRARKKTCSISI